MGVYGKCATCGEDNISVERRLDGDMVCPNGHRTTRKQAKEQKDAETHKELTARLTALEADNAALREDHEKLRADWILQRSALNAIAHTTYDNVAFAQRTATDALAIGVPAATIRAAEASNDAHAAEILALREAVRVLGNYGRTNANHATTLLDHGRLSGDAMREAANAYAELEANPIDAAAVKGGGQ